MKILTDYHKQYPELPKEFPDHLLSEEWAQRIHSQSLVRLNERGGLSPVEIIVNINRFSYRKFDELNEDDCVKKIIEIIGSQAQLNKQ